MCFLDFQLWCVHGTMCSLLSSLHLILSLSYQLPLSFNVTKYIFLLHCSILLNYFLWGKAINRKDMGKVWVLLFVPWKSRPSVLDLLNHFSRWRRWVEKMLKNSILELPPFSFPYHKSHQSTSMSIKSVWPYRNQKGWKFLEENEKGHIIILMFTHTY